MDDAANDGLAERKDAGVTLAGAAIVAGFVAVAAGGALSIIAGIVAACCLVAGFDAFTGSRETDCERHCIGGDTTETITDSQEVSLVRTQEVGPCPTGTGHRWRQTVMASARTDRSR